MPPDRHAPTQETEPANARTGPDFPSSPKKPAVAAGGKLWTEEEQELADRASSRDA